MGSRNQRQIQDEDMKIHEDVGKLRSPRALNLTLENDKGDLKTHARGMLQEPIKLRRSEVAEEQKVKKLSFTRALTDKGGKLVNDLQKESGASIGITPSHGEEETVELKGPSKSVEKAEQMMEELLSSAKDIYLSYEEKDALLIGGKNCILVSMCGRLQVPAQIQGRKLVLIGKPEETSQAREMVEEAMKGVLKEGVRGGLKEPWRSEALRELKVKELTFKKSFTRALTDKGGKLVNGIRNDSGAQILIIPSPGGIEETVVLKGIAE